MYTVVADGLLVYLGPSQFEALAISNRKPNSKLFYIEKEVYDLISNPHNTTQEKTKLDEEISNNLKFLLNKLDELGVNKDTVNNIQENGNKLIGELLVLSNKAMQAVGDGFISIGELLRQNEKQ